MLNRIHFLRKKKKYSIYCIPDNLKKQNCGPNVTWGGRQPVVISFPVKAKCLLYCCILQEAAENRSWTHAWGGCETFKHKLHRREFGSIVNVFLALHVSFWVWFTLVITSLSILSLERKRWMETVLETNMSANNAGDPIQDCTPRALLSFTRSAPLVIFGSSGDWGHNFAKHIGFLYGRGAQPGPMDPLLFFPSRVESLRSAHLQCLTVIVLHPRSRCRMEGRQNCWWGCHTMPQRGDYPWRWSKAAISETSLWTEHLVSSCLYPHLWSSQRQAKGCVCFHLNSVTCRIKMILVWFRQFFTKWYLWIFQILFYLIRLKASLIPGWILIQNRLASVSVFKGKEWCLFSSRTCMNN